MSLSFNIPRSAKHAPRDIALYYPYHEGDRFTFIIYDTVVVGDQYDVYALLINVPGVDIGKGYTLVPYRNPPIENHHPYAVDVYKQPVAFRTDNITAVIKTNKVRISEFIANNKLQLVARAIISNPANDPLLTTVGGATLGGIVGSVAGPIGVLGGALAGGLLGSQL